MTYCAILKTLVVTGFPTKKDAEAFAKQLNEPSAPILPCYTTVEVLRKLKGWN
jgi:hypothetical protein